MTTETLGTLLLSRSLTSSEAPAFSFIEKKAWATKSWVDFKRKVQNISFALLSLGIKKGDKVAILSSTRYELALSDLAAACIGAVVVPLYPKSSQKDCE